MLKFSDILKSIDFTSLVSAQNNNRNVYPRLLEQPADLYLIEKYKEYSSSPRVWVEELEYMILADTLQIWRTLRGINGAVQNKYQDLQTACHSVLNRKAVEYAKDEQRLHNFQRCQKVYGGSLASQVIDLRKKHSSSIWDILDEQEKTYSLEFLDEKFGDYVNYTLLGFFADTIDREREKEQFNSSNNELHFDNYGVSISFVEVNSTVGDREMLVQILDYSGSATIQLDRPYYIEALRDFCNKFLNEE